MLRFLVLALGVAALAACSPALNWRDVRPEGSSLMLQFPCKPPTLQRRLPLAGEPVAMTLLACRAGGHTWALSHADVGAPARVEPAMDELWQSAQAGMANEGAAAPAPVPFLPKGATPHPQSLRVVREGRLPDGTAVQLHLAVFAHGTRVFQATVIAATGDAALPAAVQTWQDAMRVER